MSLDVGDLVANLRVNTKQATTDLAKGEGQLTKQATTTGGKMGSGLSKGISGALKAGLAIGAGFIAFKGVKAFLDDSIEGAKQLNESMSRTEVVFGKSTKTVVAWASTTDKSLGLSKQAALEYAAQLGNVYAQLGFTTGESAKMAEQTTKLAVEVGAFKKVDPSDVIAAMSAGYRDQYKSLAKLIPGINKTAVETEALKETGKKSAAQLTQQEKATALLTLAQKDSSRATEFYNGEAGKLTRTQATLNAEIANIEASVGQVAIPFLEQLAHIAAFNVIPAVREAGQVIVELSHDINALPAPVKAAGASLLALVLLGPEIRDLAESVGNNLSSALETARIQALYAHDAFTTAGGGVRGLTKAIGAGAGAGLRAAAGGLLDIIGGPWGLAFIGASAAVGLLISAHEKGKAQVASYTAAIKADSGALGENTRAAVVNALSQGDSFKNAKLLGISLQDLTDDLLGNAAAHDRVTAAIEAGAVGSDQQMGRMNAQQRASMNLSNELGNQNGKLNQGVQNAKDFSSALGDTASASDNAATGQSGLAGSTDDVTSATKTATATVKTYIEKLDAYTEHALGVRSANRDWQQSLDDARQALKDNGKTLDIHTQKGRDNAAALDGMISALQAQADAESNSGTLTKKARDRLIDQRNTLIEVATKFYGSRDAAKAYVDKLLKIPKIIPTKVVLTTYDATRALGVLVGQANKLHGLLGDLPTPGFGGKTKSSADGNVLHYAGGGENHTAQIARDTVRVWNEPETGGEAYIPLGQSKRARSTSILSDVAQRFGYGLTSGGAGMAGGSGPLVSIGSYTAQHGPADFAAELRFALREAGI